MKKNTLVWGIAGLAVIILIGWLIVTPGKGGKLDAFATCLKDQGAKFYGAFWCPHCQAQKALFGRSAKLLPYIECSTPNGNSQNQVCNDAKIESYPTWEFSDATRLTGEQTLAELSSKTSCVLPE
ncbi:hypothetical protein KW785_00555 [Candidatus Parcubacteria bacterium]|nr:hypothetical protein [Candidatus Parcubacteria bacterium]